MAISPEVQGESRKVIRGLKLSFDILFDSDNKVADEFGLTFDLPAELKPLYQQFGIDLAKTQGNDRWRLPMPARYVVVGSGTVVAADFDPDYTHRPEPSATVEALKQALATT